jgi:hypothetical protein
MRMMRNASPRRVAVSVSPVKWTLRILGAQLHQWRFVAVVGIPSLKAEPA